MRTPKDRILDVLEARVIDEQDSADRMRELSCEHPGETGAYGCTFESMAEAAERVLREAQEDLEYAREHLK